jgi:hypothetical protein
MYLLPIILIKRTAAKKPDAVKTTRLVRIKRTAVPPRAPAAKTEPVKWKQANATQVPGRIQRKKNPVIQLKKAQGPKSPVVSKSE